MTVGLGFRVNRLTSFPPIAGKWEPGTYAVIEKSEAFQRMAALPVTPTRAQHVFDAVACFDDYTADWAKRKGAIHWEGHSDTARWDLDEALALDTTIEEVPGLPWILDVFERLGGAIGYATSPLHRPRLPWSARLNRIPTDAEVEELADRIGRNPKSEVECAIVVCIFERLPLPWRVRLAPMMEG